MSYNKFIVNGVTKFDCSAVTAAAGDVASGKTFVDKNGAIVTGSASGSAPAGVTVIYDNVLALSTTSTSNTNQVTLSHDFTKYDVVTMAAIPEEQYTSSRYCLNCSTVISKTTGTYPNQMIGRYCYYYSGVTSSTYTSTTGYGIFLYPSNASTWYVRTRCRNSYVTSIKGNFRIVVLGYKYS